MKKLNFLTLGLILLGGVSKAQTYQNNVQTSLVDGVTRASACGFGTQPGVEMSDITIPLTGTIVDPSKITINISVSSPWLGDLVVDLVSPSGDAITLIRRLGATQNAGCGDSSSFTPANILAFNSSNTTQIDVSSIGLGVAVPAGNYAPTYSTAKYPIHNPGDLSTFLNGKPLNGTWRLFIYDYGNTDPSGLSSWQMVVANGALLKTNETGTFGSEISLKQNPVEDYLLIDAKNDFKSLNLEIFDASGRLVKNEDILRSSKSVQLDVRNLSSGLYLLIPIKDGERKQAIKFIKK